MFLSALCLCLLFVSVFFTPSLLPAPPPFSRLLPAMQTLKVNLHSKVLLLASATVTERFFSVPPLFPLSFFFSFISYYLHNFSSHAPPILLIHDMMMMLIIKKSHQSFHRFLQTIITAVKVIFLERVWNWPQKHSLILTFVCLLIIDWLFNCEFTTSGVGWGVVAIRYTSPCLQGLHHQFVSVPSGSCQLCWLRLFLSTLSL